MLLSITTQHNTMQFILSHYFDQNMWQCMYQKLVENITFDNFFRTVAIKCAVNKEKPNFVMTCLQIFNTTSKLHNIDFLNVTPLMSRNPKTLGNGCSQLKSHSLLSPSLPYITDFDIKINQQRIQTTRLHALHCHHCH
jgi:hypothetical protein